MRAYIAGPMSGKPYFNRDLFNGAAELLRNYGWNVFNPAEHDALQYGEAMLTSNPTGDHQIAKKVFGFDLRMTLAIDLEWLCRHADAIVMLPDWQMSKGATAEYYTARALGLPVYQFDHDIPDHRPILREV